MPRKTCSTQRSTDTANPLLTKLTHYHDRLYSESDNVLSQKLSAEVVAVLHDASKVDDVTRAFTWSLEDRARLNQLNAQTKQLQTPAKWTWAAKEGTAQFEYNHKRMQFLVQHEMETIVKHYDCKGVLVGMDQVHSKCCYDCVSERASWKAKKEAWTGVRPQTLEYHGLPQLYAGDKSVLSVINPVVTVRKNYMVNAKLRKESITLMNDANQTWTKILPRTDLKDRFVAIERTSKDHSRKHIVAERVRLWLQFLFQNHLEFMSMERSCSHSRIWRRSSMTWGTRPVPMRKLQCHQGLVARFQVALTSLDIRSTGISISM